MVERKARRILLVLGDRVFEVEHDRVGAVDVRVFDQPGLLRVHEHHRAAQAELFRFRAGDHLISPPQGYGPSASR